MCSFICANAYVLRSQRFIELNLPLHVLINNAGVMLEKKELLEVMP